MLPLQRTKEQNNMPKLVVAVAIAVVVRAGPVVASQEADVIAPVHQFVDGFNKNDIKMAQAACVDQTFIIDDFPPHEWRGPRATSKWFHDLAALGKKYDMSDPFVTLLKPRQVHVTGTHAYLRTASGIIAASIIGKWRRRGRGNAEEAAAEPIAREE
jgi:hypothetical protein